MEQISTKQAPAAIGPYSQAVKYAGMIFTSGQIALSPETGQMAENDIAVQATQVLDNLKAVLIAAGSDCSHVIKTTCYLKNMEDFAAFNEIYAKYFMHKPARSTVEAARLPKDALVEVEAIAIAI